MQYYTVSTNAAGEFPAVTGPATPVTGGPSTIHSAEGRIDAVTFTARPDLVGGEPVCTRGRGDVAGARTSLSPRTTRTSRRRCRSCSSRRPFTCCAARTNTWASSTCTRAATKMPRQCASGKKKYNAAWTKFAPVVRVVF